MNDNSSVINKGISTSAHRYFSHTKLFLIKLKEIFYEDENYKKSFENKIGLTFYRLHIVSNYVSCAFCSNLIKSGCHNYCFTCHKGIYKNCSNLLPGTFSFVNDFYDSLDNNIKPWLFKTPCTYFERSFKSEYYKNFTSNESSITTANFEALEGLFAGTNNGKRPCHICASVNMDIYKQCSKEEKVSVNSPCVEIMQNMIIEYKYIPGIIKLAP